MGDANHLLREWWSLEEALTVAITVLGNLANCLGCKGSSCNSFGVEILGAEFFFFNPRLPLRVLVSERTGERTETEIEVVSLGVALGGASVLGKGMVFEEVVVCEMTMDAGGAEEASGEAREIEGPPDVESGEWLMNDLGARGVVGLVALLHTDCDAGGVSRGETANQPLFGLDDDDLDVSDDSSAFLSAETSTLAHSLTGPDEEGFE
jgi:hypothetical protein